MDSEKKDQVLFALFSAESKGLTDAQKATHVVKMRSLYGGYWSAFAPDSSAVYSETGYYDNFKYEGKFWNVYKHRES